MKHVNREGSYSIKWDSLKEHFGEDNLIPLWVADTDFQTADCIKEAIDSALSNGVYGYNTTPKEYFPTIAKWLKDMQGWSVEQEWLAFIPGIVRGIGYVINYFTQKGEGVVVQPPVYPPFLNLPRENKRELIFNPLVEIEGGYKMDLDHLESLFVKDNNIKLFILCNPHNPGGLVWEREELIRLASICYKHNVIVIADEIHADMQLWGGKHIPFASVSDEAAAVSITFGAPSKTFNMPGLMSSYAVVPNKELREEFYHWMDVNELSAPTIQASIGAIAAYNKAGEWRTRMLKEIENNILFVEEYCSANFGNLVVPMRPKASFLVWLDCRELAKKLSGSQKIDEEKLVNLFIKGAKLALNNGTAFGEQGAGFMRLNVGCSKELLERALGQLKGAVEEATR